MALSLDLEGYDEIYDNLFQQHVELENDLAIPLSQKVTLQERIRDEMRRMLDIFQSAQVQVQQQQQQQQQHNQQPQLSPTTSASLPMKRELSFKQESEFRNVRMKHDSSDNYQNNGFLYGEYVDDFDWDAIPYLAWELQQLNSTEYLAQVEKSDEEFARKLQEEEEAGFGGYNAQTEQTPFQRLGRHHPQSEQEGAIKSEPLEFPVGIKGSAQYSQGEAVDMGEDFDFATFFPEASIPPKDQPVYGLDDKIRLPGISHLYGKEMNEEVDGGLGEWPQFIDLKNPFLGEESSSSDAIDIFNLPALPAPHLDHSKPPDDQYSPTDPPESLACTETPFQEYANLLDPSKSSINGVGSFDPAANAAAYNKYYGSARTEEDLKLLLDNIQNSEFSDLREGTPEALVFPLMEHQKIGLAWMKAMEEGSNKGGILADDMGLGKTMQALALIASRRSSDENCKTTLIVAPVSLLKQWEREITRKLKPGFAMSVHIQHYASQKRCKSFNDLSRFDVVLTTFGTIASEYKKKVAWNKLREDNPGKSLEQPPELIITGNNSQWYRIIIDEAQCIKNKDTQSSRGCAELQAQYRFCLSGTPMQNSCDELFPLIRFLNIKPYNDWSEYSREFSQPLKSRRRGGYGNSLQKFRALLKAILLRRLKSSMIDGKPILTLPPKTIDIVHPVFSSDESDFYKALESRVAIQFNKYLRANAIGKNYSNILLLLLRLRQACCHPHLINDIEETSAKMEVNEGGSNANLELVAQLPEQTVQRIQNAGLEECPVCMDMSDNPSIVIPCGHMFCSDCVVKVVNQAKQANLNRGGDDEEDKTIARCPKCRGPLDMAKLIVWQTFEKVFGEAVSNQLNWEEVIGPDGRKGKGKAKADAKTMFRLRQQAFTSASAMKEYMNELERDWMTSAKIEKCIEILQDVISNNKDEKIIIFSQWTSLLKLLEVPIYRNNWKYRRYDGTMSGNARNDAVVQFTDDPEIKIMLISLKAGNSGLNLVAASQVILMDPFYNPYVEDQAIDRVHRIGQVRPIKVHRLIMEGTVEDKIITIQNEKKALIEGALDEKEAMGIGRLNVTDLAFLFGINRN